MLKLERCIGFAAAAIGLSGVALGCGSGGGKADSFASIQEEITKPTGTVSQDTVGKVGERFETADSSSSFMGVRDDDQVGASGSATVTRTCEAGGSATVTASGNESNARVAMDFNHCCFSAGCCASGKGTMFTSNDQNATYNYCASYDMDYSCAGTDAAIEYSGCFGLSGKAVMLIDVDGQSFTVSGSRSGGSGTLEITGKNGKFSCSFTAGSGNCSSSTGDSFSFTAAK